MQLSAVERRDVVAGIKMNSVKMGALKLFDWFGPQKNKSGDCYESGITKFAGFTAIAGPSGATVLRISSRSLRIALGRFVYSELLELSNDVLPQNAKELALLSRKRTAEMGSLAREIQRELFSTTK